MSSYRMTELFPGVFAIQDGRVRMYLICGSLRAVLLDTGYGGGALKAYVQECYNGPIQVVNTHGHVDHASGDGEFETVYAHPADWSAICDLADMDTARLRPLAEGDRLELGGRTLEVLETPGHTPGSITLLDRRNRLIFTGDTVSDQPVFLCLKGASTADYAASLRRLIELRDAYDAILGCHGEAIQNSAMAEALLSCVNAFMEGTLAGTPTEDHHGTARMRYTLNGASFYGPER